MGAVFKEITALDVLEIARLSSKTKGIVESLLSQSRKLGSTFWIDNYAEDIINCSNQIFNIVTNGKIKNIE